jgi:hypothetical protein
MCRQVANLEANVASDEISEILSDDEMDIEDASPHAVDAMATLGRPKLKQTADVEVVDRSQTVRNQDIQPPPLDVNMTQVVDIDALDSARVVQVLDATETAVASANTALVESATSNVTLSPNHATEQQTEMEDMPTHSQAISARTRDSPETDLMSPSTPPSFSWAMPQENSNETLPLVLYRLLTDFEQSLSRQDANSSRALIASYAASMSRFLQQAPISDEFRQELQQILNK